MKDEGFYALSVKKLCLINELNEDNSMKYKSCGFFSHEMENEEIEKFMSDNSDYIKDNIIKNKVKLNFKIVNAPDDWFYVPATEQEWDELKKEISIH